MPTRLALSMFLALPLLSASWGAAHAEEPIADRGGFFSAAAKAKAEKQLEAFGKTRKERLFVETYPEPPAKVQAEVAKRGADAAFEDWAKERVKALPQPAALVLICKKPAHLQVEVGPEFPARLLTADDLVRVKDALVDRLRKGKNDEALQVGLDELGGTIQRNSTAMVRARAFRIPVSPEAQKVVEAHHKARQAAEAGSSGWTLLLWVGGGLVALFILFALVRALLRPALPSPAYGPGGAPGPMPYGGYPAPGPGGGYPAPGGGGFMTSMFGGLFGAAAGNYLYDQFFRGHPGGPALGGPPAPGGYPHPSPNYSDSAPGAGEEGGGWRGAGGSFGPEPSTGAGGSFGAPDGGGADFSSADGTGGGADFGGDFGGAGGDFGGDFGNNNL